MKSKTTRLRFTEDELDNSAVGKAAHKAERAADKADKAKSKLRTKEEKSKLRDSAVREEPVDGAASRGAKSQGASARRTEPNANATHSERPQGVTSRGAAPKGEAAKGTSSRSAGTAAATPKSKLRTESTATKTVKDRLRFDADAKEVVSPASRGSHIATRAVTDSVSGTIHRQVAEGEDDNVGVQAAHQSEEAVETTGHVLSDASYSRKLKAYDKAAKLEGKADKANVNALYQQSLADNPEAASNLISRWKQKQAIKKEYAAAKAAGGTATHTAATAKGAQEAAKETGTVVEKISTFVSEHSHMLLVAGIFLLLILVIMGMFSSCSAMFQGAATTVAASTYPSEDADMLAAEAQYCALEQELQDYLDNYESTHDYDEYIYELDDIEHDAYVLISAITALMDGNAWTIDEVQDIIQMLFDQQYTLTETVTTETRYRTETRMGTRTVTETATDPETGEEYEYEVEEEYEYEVQVPYTYYICTVTLENFNLSHVPVYVMSEEQLERYSLYMSTLGNRPDLFAGSSYVSLYYNTDYTTYEIPSEALSDEAFANMIAEAEKYLGYPYVWDGSSPSTSFDCSGFVSWVINNCGNGWSVGRQTANGLLNLCTVVSASDAQPGDLIFFQGTYNTSGASHVGIYVGNGMMIHCGDPIQYTSINTSYWQSHFLAYGRLPGM
ncbi:MAG: C40 family peptidase [Oscillospiraceae bacterium]|nr:C40 family peptidase [Oscillospiraceae bacterium]